MWFHLRPLGVSQNESVHLKLESQSSSNENPESKQALAQRVDDFPIGGFGKRLQRARPDVSLHPQLQAETRRNSVVRSFQDHDHVKVTHGQVEGFDLAAHILESFLRSVQTAWRVLC